MKRRGFLGALAGIAAGWLFGGVFRNPSLVGWKVYTGEVVLNEAWLGRTVVIKNDSAEPLAVYGAREGTITIPPELVRIFTV